MAKKRPCSHTTIRDTNKIVKAGDCVLVRLSDMRKLPRVAHLEKIELDNRNNVNVRVRWYYRPEESIGGRRQFHGAKELFLSDQYDVLSAHNIVGKCVVHSCKNDTLVENVGTEDYYCRFEYKADTGAFTPDFVAVYCKCEMPKNPDDFMLHCMGCKNWYHPACLNMNIDVARNLDHFVCSECLYANGLESPQFTFPESLPSDGQQVTTMDPFQQSVEQGLMRIEKSLNECYTLLEALRRRLAKYQ